MFFHLRIESPSAKTKAGRISFVILVNEKYFTKFLQFLVLQSLSHTKFLKNVFIKYVIAINCIVKENLNLLLYIPAPQNDISERN